MGPYRFGRIAAKQQEAHRWNPEEKSGSWITRVGGSVPETEVVLGVPSPLSRDPNLSSKPPEIQVENGSGF